MKNANLPEPLGICSDCFNDPDKRVHSQYGIHIFCPHNLAGAMCMSPGSEFPQWQIVVPVDETAWQESVDLIFRGILSGKKPEAGQRWN